MKLYEQADMDKKHILKVFESVVFLVSNEIYYKPFSIVWSNDEIRYLIRAVFQYGTNDLSIIKDNELPHRSTESIKAKWGRIYRTSFRDAVNKEKSIKEDIDVDEAPDEISSSEPHKDTSVEKQDLIVEDPQDDTSEINSHFDPKIAAKFSKIKLTMTYRMAKMLTERDGIIPLEFSTEKF